MKTRYRLRLVMLFVFTMCHMAGAMIFKSDKVAAHWDTWAYYHEGTYYLYYLITEHGPGEGFGVATSKDGVHWEDHGWALHQSEKNNFVAMSVSHWINAAQSTDIQSMM